MTTDMRVELEKQARELTGKIKNSVCLGDDDGPYAFIPVEPLFLTILQALHIAAEAGAREMRSKAERYFLDRSKKCQTYYDRTKSPADNLDSLNAGYFAEIMASLPVTDTTPENPQDRGERK